MPNQPNHIIAVFGGSRVQNDSAEYAEAYQVGQLLARAGLTLINGGYAGTMEASARGAREAGGRVLGVTSPIFKASTLNPYVDEEIPTEDLHTRIRALVAPASGFLVLKGSQGTLAELAVVWNLAGFDLDFRKPIVLLGEFWKPVLQAFQDHLAVTPEQNALLHVVSTPEQAVEYLQAHLVPADR